MFPGVKEGKFMADRESIRRTLAELLETETGEKYYQLEDSVQLRQELGLDSLDVICIASQIERQYCIYLTNQELKELVTVNDVLSLLELKLVAHPNAA